MQEIHFPDHSIHLFKIVPPQPSAHIFGHGAEAELRPGTVPPTERKGRTGNQNETKLKQTGNELLIALAEMSTANERVMALAKMKRQLREAVSGIPGRQVRPRRRSV